jgi:hypothetical protein
VIRGNKVLKFQAAVFFALLGLTGGVPATPSRYLEIKLPPGVISESFFGRYVLAGESLGEWVQPRSGVSSYLIDTTHEGRPVSGIKAILYAPGCAIVTLDLHLSGSDNTLYSFTCRPLESITITGTVVRSDRFYGCPVQFEAKYVARWAQRFLGLGADIVTVIPVGHPADLAADSRFHLVIPDLSQDPLAGAADHSGELQIWTRDKTNDAIVAQLVPTGHSFITTEMGGLKVRNDYPPEIIFTPCAANPPLLHDKEGFAMRPDVPDACDR